MTGQQPIAEMFDLGPIDQVSYAVRSVETALPRFTALFGPFTVKTDKVHNFTYRGAPAEPVVTIGYGSSGPLQIELVEVVSGLFPQIEYLEKHGEGLHHVRFVVSDLDAKLALLRANQFTEVGIGHGPNSDFAYLEAPDFLGNGVIELIQWKNR